MEQVYKRRNLYADCLQKMDAATVTPTDLWSSIKKPQDEHFHKYHLDTECEEQELWETKEHHTPIRQWPVTLQIDILSVQNDHVLFGKTALLQKSSNHENIPAAGASKIQFLKLNFLFGKNLF